MNKKHLERAVILFLPLFTAILAFVPFVPFAVNTLASIEARLLLFLSFFCLFLSVFHSVRSNKRIETFLTLLITASFIIFLHNESIFTPAFLKSLTTNQEVILAQQYDSTGFISYEAAHSHFFQTSYIMHVISGIFGIPPLTTVYVMLLIFIVLIASIGTYISEILRKKVNVKPFASSLITFFAASSCTMIVNDASFYRDLGFAILLLFLCFYMAKPRTTRAVFLLEAMFVVGISLGSPVAAIILVLFFSVLSLFKYRSLQSLFLAIIPLSYLIFVGQEYVSRLGKYAIFSFGGLLEFLDAIFGGNIPQRVIPWRRTTLSAPLDTFLNSASYVSLLLLTMLTVVSILFLLRHNELDRKSGRDKPEGTRALLKTFSVYLFIILAVYGVTYIGASTTLEEPFSDIRTIALFFLIAVLPFAFLRRDLLEMLFSKKALFAVLTALMLLASFRMVFSVYPKSVFDPINAVEDTRLSQTVHDVGHFVENHFDSGYFVVDFRMRIVLFSLLSLQQSEVRLLDENALAHPPSAETSVLIFHINGIKYPSVFVSPKAYIEAYNLSLTRNRVYDNGDVLIVFTRLP
jgi:hypothetical protein